MSVALYNSGMDETAPSTPVRLFGHGHNPRADLDCTHSLYGLTCGNYESLCGRARNCCEICETPSAETRRGTLVIDHFQAAALFFVRGLLCDRCNAVMARHDRKQVWGPKTRPWAAKAAKYHAKSWGATAEDLALAAQYIASNTPWTVRIGGYDPRLHDATSV